MEAEISETDISKSEPIKPKLSAWIDSTRVLNQSFNVALWLEGRLVAEGAMCAASGE